jgi:hypothetical protein
MSRRCERPGCGERASVAYGFDAGRQLVWLATLAEDGPAAGALCRRHAASMALPKGWWLDDRRVEVPTLFEPPVPPAPPRERDAPHARRPRRRAEPDETTLPLLAPIEPEAMVTPRPPDVAGPVPVAPAAVTEVIVESLLADDPAEPWMPSFDTSDDLGGILDAKTPLLARAFGRTRPGDRS